MFGVSGSVSSSSSTSSSFDTSESGSQSGGTSSSFSNDSLAFEDIFASLFGGASGAASGLDPSMLTQAANSLFSSGMGFLGGIGGDAGSQYLESRLSADNSVLEEQIDLLGEDLGSFFRDELNPAITSQSVSGGQLGGGRQGVAQGMATQAVGDEFRRGASALRAGDIAARDSAAGLLSQNNIAGSQTALGALSGLYGIADMGFSADLKPFEHLAAILGDPTVLNNAGSSSMDFANAFSTSYGESQAESESSAVSAGVGFSDRRLKQNIQRVGSRNGYAWYTWKFIWGETAQGVMSDEVPAEFVTRHESGFDMVDYDRLLA